MATLTGQRIKDTYDAVLKLEDNAALTSSPKAITDGLGNNTPISVSTIKVDVSSDLEASSFVKTSGLSTQFLKADGSVDSSAYLTSGDLPASHWSSNLVGIDYAGGNVGIGTTSPSEKLEVNGNVDVNGGVYVSGVNGFVWNNTANSNLRFGANGSEKMRITSAGNVGIGTTSPSQKLDVNGNIKLNQYGQSIYFGSTVNEIKGSTSDFLYKSFSRVQWDNAGTYADSSYVFKQSGSEVFRIHTGGNVGIGTTAPLYKLDIDETTTNNLIVSRFKHNQSGVASAMQLENRAGAVNSAFDINWGLNSSGNQGTIGVVRTNLPAAGGSEMYFKTSYGEAMRIDGSGNVGIGTTSPSTTLDVAGSITTSGTLIGPSLFEIIAQYSNRGRITLNSSTNTGANQISLLTNGNVRMVVNKEGNVGIGTTSPSAALEVVGGIKLSDNSPLTWATSNTRIFGQVGYMQFQVGSTDKMRITSAGNVGIGTTAPSTPLHINADAPTIRLQDATSGDNHYLTGNNGELRVQSSGYITMRPGATVSTTFLANGNVGIGTTSPSAKLEVAGSVGNFKTTGHQIFLTRNANNEIYAVGASSVLALGQNSAEKMRIHSNGNVGIGTTSPNTKLQVTGNGTILSVVGASNSGVSILSNGTNDLSYIYFADSVDGDVGGLIYDHSTNGFTVRTGGNNRHFIGSNVGIGTTSPSEKLEVNGNAIVRGDIVSRDTYPSIYVNHSGTVMGGIRADGTNKLELKTLTTAPLSFQVNTSEKMRILSSGYVGIGTTSPSRTLSVKSSSSSMVADFRSVSGNNSFVSFSNNASTADQVRLGSTSGNLVLSTNYTERMRIDASGNVGIGTTSPSEKLEVDGQVLSDGYRLAAMQTAPATRNSTGTLGEIVIDGNYIYVCYAANSWSRVALETSW